jgi:hypothetical protein
MVLGLAQPLTEMSTRSNALWGKMAGAWVWQPFHLHVPIVLKYGNLNLLEPSGPVQTCNWFDLPFTVYAYQMMFPLAYEKLQIVLNRNSSV